MVISKNGMKVIKFGGSWCGPCRTLDTKLKDFTLCEVIKYDVDECDDALTHKYNIRTIPVTILLDDNDTEIKRWIGLFDIKELEQCIDQK